MATVINAVHICNMALGKLGEREKISSLTDDNSEAARTCNLHYEHTRDTLLESHTWNFAMSRAALSLDSTAPAFEFTNAFQIPADCLRVYHLWNSQSDYEVEGDKLLTDDGTAKIKYISKETNPAKFSSLFVEAFATRLAGEMADQLTNSQRRRVELLRESEIKLREAKRRDSQENRRGRTVSRGPSNRYKNKPIL